MKDPISNFMCKVKKPKKTVPYEIKGQPRNAKHDSPYYVSEHVGLLVGLPAGFGTGNSRYSSGHEIRCDFSLSMRPGDCTFLKNAGKADGLLLIRGNAGNRV